MAMGTRDNHTHQTPIIQVRGLNNRFGSHSVHEDLDLDLYPGEILGVVGGSGTGKSVLLRSIVGLNTPTAGHITVFGQDLTELSAPERSLYEQRFGVLFQGGALFTSLNLDRKSTRLNSSHVRISYAVFCLKKKKKKNSRNII